MMLASASAAFLTSTGPVVHRMFSRKPVPMMLNPDKSAKSLRHLWRFDDVPSSTVLMEFDKNSDLSSTCGTSGWRITVFSSLAEYHYFQVVTADQPLAMKPLAQLMANYENDQLIIQPGPAEEPAETRRRSISVYDPTF
jgi:ABC-type uncharacterized transport system substrate-binding protein